MASLKATLHPLEEADTLRKWLSESERDQHHTAECVRVHCASLERICTRLRGENRYEANRIIEALRALVKDTK